MYLDDSVTYLPDRSASLRPISSAGDYRDKVHHRRCCLRAQRGFAIVRRAMVLKIIRERKRCLGVATNSFVWSANQLGRNVRV